MRKTIIKRIIAEKDDTQIINSMSNEMLVKLSVKCNEGTFDISKYLYKTPASILSKTPADYTKEDIELMEQLAKVQQVTKTIAKPLIPPMILKEVKDIQYEVKKEYEELILMPAMPIMELDGYKKLKESIAEAEKKLKALSDDMVRLWDDNIEQFEHDIREAYPDAPEENINYIIKIAKSKKSKVIGKQGFEVTVTVLPTGMDLNDELKEIVANQSVDNMRLILETAVTEAFNEVVNVYMLAEKQKEGANYLVHGKTKKCLPKFAKNFRRKMSVIGAKNLKDVKEIQKQLDSLNDTDTLMNEAKIVNICGNIAYNLINLASDNDIELNIPEALDLNMLEVLYADIAVV